MPRAFPALLLLALPPAFVAASQGRAADEDPSLVRGEALWREHACADCHAHATEPGQPTLLLSYLGDRFTEESLTAFLSAPPRPMPNPGLSPQDRRALARYLLTTFP